MRDRNRYGFGAILIGAFVAAALIGEAAMANWPPGVTQSQLAAVAAAIPQPATGIPLGPTPTGQASTAATKTFVPGDAMQPSLTRSARVTTAADGTFSITWATPLSSATPVTPNPAPINTSTQPITCNVTSANATTETGKCWTTQSTLLTLANITANVTLNPATQAAGGITVSVFAREPTQ